jgi:hypothetical protein
VLLTVGYVVVSALMFAALSLSPLDLITFPVVVTLWTAYLWVFTASSIRTFSVIPRSPRRVAAIMITCSLIAIAALAASIVIGSLIAASRT